MTGYAAYFAQARRGVDGPEYVIASVAPVGTDDAPPNALPGLLGLAPTRAAALDDLSRNLAHVLGHATAIALDLDARDRREAQAPPLFEEVEP